MAMVQQFNERITLDIPFQLYNYKKDQLPKKLASLYPRFPGYDSLYPFHSSNCFVSLHLWENTAPIMALWYTNAFNDTVCHGVWDMSSHFIG